MKSLHVFLCVSIAIFQFACTSISHKPGTTNPHEASIAFYNVENLFDTINDPLINDEEFLPDGRNNWNSSRYNEKIKHINTVIDLLQNPLLIGMAEIENAQVVRDVIRHSSRPDSFGLVHFQSTDARGIDVALIYDSSRLDLKNSGFIRFDLTDEDGSIDHTRDILWAEFKNRQRNTLCNGQPLGPAGGADRKHPTRNACWQHKMPVNSSIACSMNTLMHKSFLWEISTITPKIMHRHSSPKNSCR